MKRLLLAVFVAVLFIKPISLIAQAYDSFTVGVETDDRLRKVKLNLAEDVPGVSEEFKNT